ncbi:cytochrome P450 2K6 isoform X2 [Xenopus tropicalis]|uniref:Cytochrome P450 2K6 isoform X2 n=1 Tax=Xenopus tropicalis TaxID=8364 RepID=A0A8J0QK92_XENTR|nr:cytochrome P450 2K6 isoform X2 [Xenopus tropicalis]
MLAADPMTILLSAFICLLLGFVLFGKKRNVCQNFPPGPRALPVIGNLLLMDRRQPYKTLMEVSKKYGPIFSVRAGPLKMVVLCGYDTVKDALINYPDEFADRPALPLFDEVVKGHGIFFSNGENWKVMRRFGLSALRDFGMGKKTIESKINEECDHLVQKFNSYGGKPFDTTMIMNAAAANIIASILLSHRFQYENPTLLRLLKLVNENIRLMASPIALLYNTYPSIMRWVPGCHKTIYKNAQELMEFIRVTFSKHKAELDINDQRNLIDAFLSRQQEEKPHSAKYFHDDNLTILVFDLFAAGMETTSTTLRWALLLMMKYPEIQKKVQDEIEKVIGSVEPRAEHRKEMPYTDAVLHEIQRFGNITPMNGPHATTKDITFRGFFLPKGTYVIPLLASVLKDENYFEKPNEFYPEHFLDSEGHFVKNEAFLPFSAGRRSCAGETLARMELFLFFTSLLQNFTFQAPPGVELDLTPDVGGTVPPRPHTVCALPRA